MLLGAYDNTIFQKLEEKKKIRIPRTSQTGLIWEDRLSLTIDASQGGPHVTLRLR